MNNPVRHLLDINVLIALLDEDHIHHSLATDWFQTPGLQWAVCAFTEAGYLRHMTRPLTGDMKMDSATAILGEIAKRPGYHYIPITAGWHALSSPFFQRVYGTQQVTDAYLLGIAIKEDLVLVTMDRAILHMAGAEYRDHVLLLHPKRG